MKPEELKAAYGAARAGGKSMAVKDYVEAAAKGIDLKAIEEQTQKGMRNGNGYMAWVENDVLRDLLAEVKRLQAELDRCTSGNGTYISIESHNRLTAESERIARDARNELCLKCGRYHEAHNGACDGCKWRGVKGE